MNQSTGNRMPEIISLDEATRQFGSKSPKQFRIVRKAAPVEDLDPNMTLGGAHQLHISETLPVTILTRMRDSHIVGFIPHDGGKAKVVLYDSDGEMVDLVDADLVAKWESPVNEDDEKHLSQTLGLSDSELEPLIQDLIDNSGDEKVSLDFVERDLDGVKYRYEDGRVEYVEWKSTKELQEEIESAYAAANSKTAAESAQRLEDFAAAESEISSGNNKIVLATPSEVKALEVTSLAKELPDKFQFLVIKKVPFRIDVKDITTITAQSGGVLNLQQEADGEIIIALVEPRDPAVEAGLNQNSRNLLNAFFLKLMAQGAKEMQLHIQA